MLNEEKILKLKDEIFAKISYLVKNKDEIIKYGENSKKWILNHYNIEQNIKKYANIYNKIL